MSSLSTSAQGNTMVDPSEAKSAEKKPRNISSVELEAKDARWVTLKVIDWEDQEGRRRKWEVASRKTTGSGGVDAVDIVALLRSSKKDEPLSTIIVEQYRPPCERITIEFPAGLVDNDEKAETAARRELEEETGFKAAGVLDCTPVLWSDPGMTTATMQTVVLDVPVSSIYDEMPRQNLDEGEHIVLRIVPIRDLKDVLKEYASKGCAIDARLSHFALSWDLSRRVAAGASIFTPSVP